MKKILVVDDDPVLQRILVDRLGHRGYEVKGVLDGIDAMVAVRKEVPDLILLDIMMPELNGYEVCRVIKFDPTLKHIPIILLTGRDQELDPKILSIMGIEYMHKSASPQDLLALIDKVLSTPSSNA